MIQTIFDLISKLPVVIQLQLLGFLGIFVVVYLFDEV